MKPSAVGGFYKTQANDFVVEEIPAYEPGGAGDHLFLWIEKRDLSHDQLMQRVRKRLKLADREIGTAGIKDKRAVTRQMISVPASAWPNLVKLDDDQLNVLRVHRHRHKLRTGHLRGNRFTIRLRGVAAQGLSSAGSIARRLGQFGVPNYYGPQRFGRQGQNVARGLRLLEEASVDPSTSAGGRRVNKRTHRLILSSVQSAWFNLYLLKRTREGLLHRVIEGEVMRVCASGGLFRVDDVAREQNRFDQRDIVPAGPMIGPKLFPAAGEGLRREQALWEETGFGVDALTPYRRLLAGARRPIVVWPDLQVCGVGAEPTSGPEAEVGQDVQLRFALPPGSYATVVLREFGAVESSVPEPQAGAGSSLA